jgi:hypothetical protein
MALMLPSHPHEKTPPGEVEVFNRLRNDPDTTDWIVLHSLEIAQHVSNAWGEADFLILIPEHGILCLEVKSHAEIRRTSSGWFFGKDPKPDGRGPFKQASEAMHSLRNYLIKNSTGFEGALFWSGTCFPSAPFNEKSCEWDDWQCIDKAKFRGSPISKLCKSILIHAKQRMLEAGHHWVKGSVEKMTRDNLEVIARILRPCFEIIPKAHTKISVLEAEIERYTEQQFRALDISRDNPRVVFPGPAGTGKTLISIEAALRAKKEKPDAVVKWICYNKNLSRWVKKKSPLKAAGIEVMYKDEWLLRITNAQPTQAQYDDQNYWDFELPELAMEKITSADGIKEPLIDSLVLDEAQDLTKDGILDFLDFMLKGGMSTGNWYFFGDYSMQAIYHADYKFDLQTFNGRCVSNPIFRLDVNCRNRPRTAYSASTLGKMRPGYSSILREDDQLEPKYETYSSSEEQLEYLLSTLDSLKKEGYKNENIVILSMLKTNALALLLKEDSNWKTSITANPDPESGKLRYSTIHSFKGLEAPIIIITDIEHVSNRRDQMLLYTGLTRSTDRVYAFINQSAQNDLINILSS